MADHLVDFEAAPRHDRCVIAWVGAEMDRFGCEITAIVREPVGAKRWQVQWAPKDIRSRSTCFGASGSTLAAAAEAALANGLELFGQIDGGVESTWRRNVLAPPRGAHSIAREM